MSKAAETEDTNFTVTLRFDQRDLIVLAMQQIRRMADANPESAYSADKLGRKFLRRRVDEIVEEIQASVPETGE